MRDSHEQNGAARGRTLAAIAAAFVFILLSRMGTVEPQARREQSRTKRNTGFDGR